MVGLVVDDDDVLLVAQLAADAAHHLVGGLGEGARLAAAAEDALGQLAGGDFLAELEGVEVGDQDLGLAQLGLQVGRDDVALAVVVVAGRWAGARAAGRGW